MKKWPRDVVTLSREALRAQQQSNWTLLASVCVAQRENYTKARFNIQRRKRWWLRAERA